jgi:enoyl-CoA hydratase
VYRDVRYEVDGHVAILTLARPEVHNALRFETYDELECAVRSTEARVLVVTGDDPTFCAGDDLKAILKAGGAHAPSLHPPRLTPAAEALLKTRVPVVAAVNGPAVGWGMELALLADLRIASERARFGEIFVKRGLCCDVAGLGRLVQLVGRERAAELLFTGRVVDAQEADRLGLVGRVVKHDELMPRTLELAHRIAENPPLAVGRLKEGLRLATDPDWDALGRWVSGALEELFKTEDHREGVDAFLEKREAAYVGR